MAPPPRFTVVCALTLAAGVLLGCDRGIEPYVPGEAPEAPDLSRIFPEGAQRAQPSAEAAQGEPAPRGGRGAPPVVADTGDPIRGTVVLAPEFAERVTSDAVLFLIARHGEEGPPLAVKRIESPRFPLPFELGPADRMIATIPFVGPIRIAARLDADGNAMTQATGDLQGATPAAVEPGAADVEIVIDQVL